MRSDHVTLLLAHLDWRRGTETDRQALGHWRAERAVEHDALAALMALSGEHLRPPRAAPTDRRARALIATARAEAHREVERLLSAQLPLPRRTELDALLDGGGERSELAALRQAPGASSWPRPTATGG